MNIEATLFMKYLSMIHYIMSMHYVKIVMECCSAFIIDDL